MKIINPATEKPIVDLQEDTKEQLQTKINELHTSQKSWAATTLAHRIAIIKAFSELLNENKDKIAYTLTTEMGKPITQSINEINGARTRIDWLVNNVSRYLSDEVMYEDDKITEKITYEPLGTICNISAWNYPYLVGINVIVPGLLAGNTIMYKPSEYASLTGLLIRQYLIKAGVPEDVFHIAIGDAKVGEQLLDADFDGYFFTGSYKTGAYIYNKIAPKMVTCQLELGGKDPLYITDEILDIKSVAQGTADGAFYNNGQSCCAVERIYVHEKIYDEYVQHFLTEVLSWKMDSPLWPDTYLGPLSRPAQLRLLQSQVDDAISKGAKLLCGGSKADRVGYYYMPTVLVDVNHSMQVMTEESFGPIIGIMKVANDVEAITLMNDTVYGLTASVYSHNENRANEILRAMNTGTGYWNCCDRVSAALPWSGRKHSGIGATLSHQGIRAFARTKALHLRK